MSAHFIFLCTLPNCPPKRRQHVIYTFHMSQKPPNISRGGPEWSASTPSSSPLHLHLHSRGAEPTKVKPPPHPGDPSQRRGLAQTLTAHAPLPTQPNVSWPNCSLRGEGRVQLDSKPLIFNLGIFWPGLPCLHLCLNHLISTCMDSTANTSTPISRIFPCRIATSIY